MSEPARSPFSYTVLRVVPRVERAEFINAGVVLHCPERRFLGARVGLDRDRLAALAPDCRIELRTRIDGQERITLMTRDEYVEMLTSGYASFKDLQSYDYAVDDQTVTIERDAPAAMVVSHVTETMVFAGQRQVTHSEETARVERRADGLKLVGVSALTTAP